MFKGGLASFVTKEEYPMTSSIRIRPATREDCPTILAFITELAIYEKAPAEVIASEEDLKKTLFNDQPRAHALLCLLNDKPIGYAVYFYNYSTWQGKYGLYLEDLYISPEFRGLGAGKKILHHLANIALENDCGRFEWSVLDWNKPAIDFYDSIGAKPKNEWLGYRLDGDALNTFAGSQ
jgi:GNAT superfamily N-acetyltransferase